MTESQRPTDGAAPPQPIPPQTLPPVAPAPTAAPLASVIAKPSGSSGRGTSLLLGLAAAIAIGGVAFAGGRLSAPAATATGGFAAGGGQAGARQVPGVGQGALGRGSGFGGVTLSGTVSAVSGDSLTVTLATGTEVTIPLDTSTQYHAATPSSASEVTVGSSVSVTPGVRAANPDPSQIPDASGAPGFAGGSFGPATDVTVVQP